MERSNLPLCTNLFLLSRFYAYHWLSIFFGAKKYQGWHWMASQLPRLECLRSSRGTGTAMTSYEETWLCQWHYLPNSHFSRKNCDFQWIFGVPQDFHPHVATKQDLAPHSSELVPTTRHVIPWKTELVPWDSHQSPIANSYQVVYSSRMRTVGAP
jgi:hypothetical protein